MNPPRVSGIIPLFNKERYIARAVGSVLGQSFEDYELIVVDDGSTDGGPDIVRDMASRDGRVILFSQENQGPAGARNAGIARARAPWVAFLDADDEWRPGFLGEALRLAEGHPELGLVAANYRVVYPDREEIAVPLEALEPGFQGGILPRPFRLWARAFFVCTSSVLARRDVLETLGGFREDMPAGEDRNLWAKIMLRYPVGFIPEVLAVYHKDVESAVTLEWRDWEEPPPFLFAKEFFDIPERVHGGQENLRDFLDYRRASLENYLVMWSAAGRWHHAARVAKEEGVSLFGVLRKKGVLGRGWFYRMNLRRLLVLARLIRPRSVFYRRPAGKP